MKIGHSLHVFHVFHVSAPPPKKYCGHNNPASCAGYRENRPPKPNSMPTALEQVGRVQAEDKDRERKWAHSFVVTWSPNNLRDCYGIRIAKETVKQLQIPKASCQESGEASGGSFPVFLGSRAQATYSRSPEPQSFINEFVYIFLFFFLFFILRFADSLVN